MNEDDTARMLTRPTLMELIGILDRIPLDEFNLATESDVVADAMFRKYGWTLDEFRTKFAEIWIKDQKETFGY